MEDQMTLANVDVRSSGLSVPTGSRLLAPHRAAVDSAENAARAALDAMDDDCKGTMAWDSCEDAIEHRNLCWLYNSRNDVKDNLWNAKHRRDGYDTWPSLALRKHIDDLARLLDAMTVLIAAINHLAQREAEELSANTVVSNATSGSPHTPDGPSSRVAL